jgi:hypothetical protein
MNFKELELLIFLKFYVKYWKLYKSSFTFILLLFFSNKIKFKNIWLNKYLYR